MFKFRISIFSLLSLLSFSGLIVALVVLQVDLANTQSKLKRISVDILGLEIGSQHCQFSVVRLGRENYGGKTSHHWPFPTELGGVFLISVSDRSQHQLQLEFFDGVSKKLSSKRLPTPSHQTSISIQTRYSKFSGEPDSRFLYLKSPGKDDTVAFAIPYTPYFDWHSRPNGLVDNQAMLAIVFFEKREADQLEFCNLKLENASVEDIHQAAIKNKLKIAYFRFLKADDSELSDEILDRQLLDGSHTR